MFKTISLVFFVFVMNLQFVFACPCTAYNPPQDSYCNCIITPDHAQGSICYNYTLCGVVILDESNNPVGCDTTNYYRYTHCGYGFSLIEVDTASPDIGGPTIGCGSIVEVQNQVLRESIPLLGSNLNLVYGTDRVIGRTEKFNYTQIIPVPYDVDVTEVFVIHTVDGTPTTYNYGISVDTEYNYTWDGLNGSSQEVIDGVDQLVEVEYEFNNTTRTKIYETKPKIGFYNAKLLGIGGFTISNHHFYNLKLRTIHFGDGTDKIIEPIKIDKTGDVIEKLAPEATSFTNYLVVSLDASEAYVFDLDGYHTETRSTRTSKVLTTFTYDINKKLTSIEDAFGNEFVITRPNSTTVEIETPSGKTTTLTLNLDGFAEEVVTPNSEVYEMTYSSVSGQTGLMTTFETPTGLISTFTYDASGRLLEDSNNAGQIIELNLIDDEIDHKLIEAISAECRISQYYTSLLPAGESATAATKPTGASSSENNQDVYYSITNPDLSSVAISRTEDPRFGLQAYTDSSTTNYSHQATHQIDQVDTFTYLDSDLLKLEDHTKTVTYDAKDWVTTYDEATQTYTLTTPLSRTQKTKYNNFDQLVETKDASFSAVVYTYDVKGRVEEITQNTRVWEYTYNLEDEVDSITNPLSETTSYVYDNNGRVTETTYPNSEKAYLDYDEVGNIKKIKAGTKPWHEFLYNLFGGLFKYIMPDLGSGAPEVEYAYNNDKQLTQIKREDLSEINFTYGATTGLLEEIETPEGDYTYTTDLVTEKLTEIEAPDATKIQYTYLDDVLQFHRIRDGVNNSSYKYDYSKMLPNKRTLRHQDSNSNVNHVTNITYNNDRLVTVVGAQTLTRTASTGLISATSLTGGMTEQYTYNSNYGEVATYNAKYSTTQKYNETYTRDALGRTTQRVETINASPSTTHNYVYDSRGRLIEAKLASVIQRKYFYDSNSNRTSVENAATNVLAVGTYDDQDQMLTYQIKNAGGTTLYNYTYAYDDFGNRLTKIDSTNNTKEEYVYSSLGALESYTRKNATTLAVLKTVVYKNDAQGRRLTKTEDGTLQIRYIYDESIRLVGEVDPAGDILTHYIYADKSHAPAYMNRSGTNYKFITNEQGSIRFVMLASTGVVQQEITYDEYGNIIADTNSGFQPFGFAGGIYDPDTKLTRFGARDYDAEIGRWTAKDPIRFNGGDTNLYGYVAQDPIGYIDPTGLRFDVGGGGGIGGAGISGGGGIGGTAGAGIGAGIGSGIGAAGAFPTPNGDGSCKKGDNNKKTREQCLAQHEYDKMVCNSYPRGDERKWLCHANARQKLLKCTAGL